MRTILVRLAVLLLLAPRLAAQQLTPAQTIGREISGGMTTVNVTQDSLAKLVGAGLRSATSSASSRVARLSAIRNGAVTAGDSELVAIGTVLMRLWLAQRDSLTERHVTVLYWQTRLALAPPVVPLKSVAITTSRLISPFNDVYGVWLADSTSGIHDRQRVTLRNHSAVPSLNGLTLYARVRFTNLIGLYRDSLFAQPVTVATLGNGGTVEWRP